VGGTFFSLKRKGLKEEKTTGTRNSLKAGTRERISFGIRDSDGSIVTISCSTLPTMASDTPVTDWAILKKRWNHLADLPVTMTGGRVDILICRYWY
jgi:hypothetical protein